MGDAESLLLGPAAAAPASSSPSRIVDAAVACLAAACALYAIARAAMRLQELLFRPLDYRADSAHLNERAPVKRGRVTRNLPGWSASATASTRQGQQQQEEQEQGRAPYPNGWFFVDLSAAFATGCVRHISMLGLELAVFRDDEGAIHALDAYCPHLGTNMAIGGRVVGDCLECPFHGWQFRGGDGKCQQIPGAKRVPEASSTHSWRVLERNGAVFLWHHADDSEPTWLPPETDELGVGHDRGGSDGGGGGGGLTQLCGRTEHVVYSHIQDIPENGADIAHFDVVHKAASTLGSDMRLLDTAWMGFGWHKWQVISPWAPLEQPDGHVAKTTLIQDIVVGNKDMPFVHMDVDVAQIGPGIVYLILHNKFFGRDLLLCQYVVPEEPLKQRVTHLMYAGAGMFNRLYGKVILAQECNMVERDIQIWNNKCFRPHPVLTASVGDENLLKFRRWFSQFYSPLSSDQQKESASIGRNAMDW